MDVGGDGSSSWHIPTASNKRDSPPMLPGSGAGDGFKIMLPKKAVFRIRIHVDPYELAHLDPDPFGEHGFRIWIEDSQNDVRKMYLKKV